MKHEDRKAKKAINDVKYAPSGSAFVAASEDGRCYIHEAADFSLRMVCTKTPTPVKTLDWSLDGEHMPHGDLFIRPGGPLSLHSRAKPLISWIRYFLGSVRGGTSRFCERRH